MSAPRSALVGYSGFVGQNLDQARAWTDRYNSKNFQAMAGQSYDLLVCAGVSAAKWLANKDPAADQAAIAALTDVLATVQVKTFVLVSTIDVYPDPCGVDEDSAVDAAGHHAYGRHRLQLEQWVQRHFGAQGARVLVVRLPGCFGPFLKKNVLFDLLHRRMLAQIDPEGVFQYYDVRRLWRDIEIALAAGLPLVNLAVAPLAVATVAEAAFGVQLPPRPGPHGRYDFHTRHAAAWGRSGPYLQDADEVCAALCAWVAAERRQPTTTKPED